MKFTPENLLTLPVGKYSITRNPYISSPEHVETNGLHISVRDGERVYFIGEFLNRFTMRINSDKESNALSFEAFVTVSNSLFCMSEISLLELRKYTVEIK